ncbi:MAG: peroxide stress protein YaaA [Planctomycetes bacterium]|nr:peroxide stress protein YaaA [Planctomycetota bacterium]
MSQKKIRILVAASDRKRAGGAQTYSFREAQEERAWNRFPSITSARDEAVREFLSAINGQGHGEEVLRLAGGRLARATQKNLAFRHGGLLPVLERERGPLFSALEALPPGVTRRLMDDMIVVCPLLGILAPTDMVPEYRCPVGAQIPGWGSLHTHWKKHLGPVLTRLCRNRRVFSFLPNRLRALWAPGGSVGEFITIQFATRRNDGGLRIENAGAGKLAGAMIRAMFDEDLTDPSRLQAWQGYSGHAYSAVHSERSEGRWSMVFVR